jgi:hypothetical protein
LAGLFADIDQLNAPVLGCVRLAAVQQLLLAQSDRFYPRTNEYLSAVMRSAEPGNDSLTTNLA